MKHRGMIALGVLGVCACSGSDGVKVSVTSLTVTPSSATVLVGWSLRLEAITKDVNGVPLGQAVSWRSDNPSIATVDGSGLVTGVAAGQTRIIATADGLSDTAIVDATQDVVLGVGDYASLAPLATSGAITFPANASAVDSAIYLVVPQIAVAQEGAITAFTLTGGALPAFTALAAGGGASSGPPADLGIRFHDFLRQQERNHYAALVVPPALRGPAAPVAPSFELVPPTVGSQRSFKVCADLFCSTLTTVSATAKVVTGHLAIYVDDAAPANGLSQADLDALGTQFNSRLYAVDTTAYGRESDIDGNSVVIVLMTNAVNELVTAQQCQTQGFIAGFFFGADIDPRFASQFNHGEVFYSIVADSAGTLSCAHTASQLKNLVPVTFVHEFQHMISYNQHVLVRNSSPQETWLDEGMSHFAEELGGRSFLPGDQVSFSNFVINDLLDAYRYLDSSGTNYLVFPASIGTLAERGAVWLFVRHLADQYARSTSLADVSRFTRAVTQTSLVGGAGLESATGVTFETLVERWALANYVSDLPGFVPPPELTYASWDFRTTFASLNQQRPSVFPKVFPLTPPLSAGPAVALGDSLRAGSPWYLLVAQGPSEAGFTLQFARPTGPLPAALRPRLTVIRLR